MHLASSVTANIRTDGTTPTTTSSLGPKKLRALRNLLSRGKRRHLRMRSTNSAGRKQNKSNNKQNDMIVKNNNNNNTENAMKVKEREKVKDKKYVGEVNKEERNVDEDGVVVNGDTSDACKSENKTPSAVTHPAHEKILYDTRIRRKNVLALNEKVAAIREYEKAPVYKRVGRIFHCSPDQIKRIVQQKDSILEAWDQRTRRCHDAKTLEMKVVRVSMLGKAVYDWLRRMIYYQDIQITDGLIQKTALQFKSAMGLQNFFPHQDWCDKFRQIYKIHTADSKLLKIGYTQGHSVQIKDVMKDVLNECTPDAGENQFDDHHDMSDGDDNQDDNGANDRDDNNDDDEEDDDDDVQEIKEDFTGGEIVKKSERNRENDTGAATSAKRRHLMSSENIRNCKQTSNINIALKGTTNLVTVANHLCLTSANANKPCASSASSKTQNKSLAPASAMQNVSKTQLPPLRQLMALPLQGNVPGMPQKVLVATPITPAGQVPGVKPMTMTIIPLATIAQSQSIQQASSAAAASVSANAATANTTPTAALATTTATAATPVTDAEKSAVPTPMLDIKKEIKQEPVEVKQECISDEEDEEIERATGHEQYQQQQQQQPFPKQQSKENVTQQSSKALSQQKRFRNGTIAVIKDGDASSCNGTDTEERCATESADDENIALANLRKLIQTEGKIIATATPPTPQPTASVSRSPSAATSTSSVPTMASRSILTPATLIPFSSRDRQSLPTSSTAITCIPTANLTSMTRSLSFTPPLPPLTKAPDAVINRLASKRKRTSNYTPIMPPIKTCTEARKYLKLLEDFALVKENFRLIGLITRADEVLRELDGDDDVDVD